MTIRNGVILLGGIALVAIGFAVYILHLQPKSQKTSETITGESVASIVKSEVDSLDISSEENQEIFDVIIDHEPHLVDSNGQFLFSISKTVQPIKNWYVATFKYKGSEDGPYKVVLSRATRSDQRLIVVAGPTNKLLETTEIPKEVREALK